MNHQAKTERPNCTLFRGTHRVKGRQRIIDQTNSGLDYLRYGRIVLDDDAVDVDTGDEEMAFFCAGGVGEILVGNQSYELEKYDALYVPRETRCRLSTGGSFDVVEVAAPSSKAYPVQLVRFEDIKKDPEKAKAAGFVPYSRKLHTVIGDDNVRAARLLCGVTFSEDGNWTSWPPHHHDDWKEEIYLYVDMPAPDFGVHLNYTDPDDMEMVEPVWEGDAVAIKRGYHTNVATPGSRIGFIWMMAAIREEEDRKFTTVTVQPEFAGDRFKLF